MPVAIGLGLAEFPFSGGAAFWRWVRRCEEAGLDSLWQTDRIVSAEPYLESMSVMAALAGATERIKFGTNVVGVGLRDPLLLAKQCATIDVLSGGRLLPAFGVGSPRGPEWSATGRAGTGHGTAVDEALEIMARLWREERVTFEGRHHRLIEATIAPRPVQDPLPLWLGGTSAAAVRRTARFATGWLGGADAPATIGAAVAAIKTAAAALGRRIPPSHFGASFACRIGSWDDAAVTRATAGVRRLGRDPRDSFAVGDAAAIVERLGLFVDAGIAKFVLRPIADSDADMTAQTEHLLAEVLPAVPRLDAAWRRRAAP